MKKNVWQTLDSYLCMLEESVGDNGHLLVQVPQRSGLLWKRIVHKKSATISRRRCCLNLPKAHVPVFRATTPLSRGQLRSKGHGKLSMHFTADCPTIETLFRIIVSANQLSLHGAVSRKCVKNMRPIKIDQGDLIK